ncbi:MAG: hypothetical protein GY810_16380 [Aureispira sp.]|nr:hypothetical protein [Aureispira sp.]
MSKQGKVKELLLSNIPENIYLAYHLAQSQLGLTKQEALQYILHTSFEYQPKELSKLMLIPLGNNLKFCFWIEELERSPIDFEIIFICQIKNSKNHLLFNKEYELFGGIWLGYEKVTVDNKLNVKKVLDQICGETIDLVTSELEEHNEA